MCSFNASNMTVQVRNDSKLSKCLKVTQDNHDDQQQNNKNKANINSHDFL